MMLKLFTTFIVVAAIWASPKHRACLPDVIVPVCIEFTGFDSNMSAVYHLG